MVKKLSFRSLKPKRTPRKAPDYSNCGVVTKGVRHKLSITQFLRELFIANENWSKSRKMTDAELERQVLIEFPEKNNPVVHRQFKERNMIPIYRGNYNRGVLITSRMPPTRDEISFPYDEDGNRLYYRNQNKIASKEIQEEVIEGYIKKQKVIQEKNDERLKAERMQRQAAKQAKENKKAKK